MLFDEITLTNDNVINIIEFITLLGFLFLAILTFVSYRKLKAKLLLYIALAFSVLVISLVFQVVLPLIESINASIGEITLDTIGEAIQFIAAALFFIGLKLIKK
jgi:hypothetical protein